MLRASLTALALTLAAGEALACSCMAPDRSPARVVADGAPVIRGRVLSQTPVGEWERRYRIAVTDRLNVDTADEIEVTTARDGAMCGVGLPLGQPAVLLIGGAAPEWRISLCSQLALQGQPQPDWDALFAAPR